MNKLKTCEISGNLESTFDKKWDFINEFKNKVNLIIPNSSDYDKQMYTKILKILAPYRNNIIFSYYNEESDILKIQKLIAKTLPDTKKKHVIFEEWEIVNSTKIDSINKAIGNEEIRIIYYNYFDKIINSENWKFLNSINRSRDSVNKTHIYFIKNDDKIIREMHGHLNDYRDFWNFIYPNE